jgi:hypothetical protein
MGTSPTTIGVGNGARALVIPAAPVCGRPPPPQEQPPWARQAKLVICEQPIENGLHWVLDVTMNKDWARNRKDRGPENLALLRRLALNLAKLEPSKGSMKGKIKRAGWDNAFLTQLLARFAHPQMR